MMKETKILGGENIMKTNAEYRAEAKQALSGNWGMAIIITLVYGLLVNAVNVTVIGGILLEGALFVGYAYTLLMCNRRGVFDINDLFQGFRVPNFASTIGLGVKKALLILAWSLLFVVPGIVKTFSYSMAEYIMADHPEMTGIEAITASKNLMNGKKGKLFGLYFSFIGWILLSCITCGIGFFWVGPWMSMATTKFYESIKDEV